MTTLAKKAPVLEYRNPLFREQHKLADAIIWALEDIETALEEEMDPKNRTSKRKCNQLELIKSEAVDHLNKTLLDCGFSYQLEFESFT